MSATLITLLATILIVAFFAFGISLALTKKDGSHREDAEISTHPLMRENNIKCAVQETREMDAAERGDGVDCGDESLCSGNCAGCDIEHNK